MQERKNYELFCKLLLEEVRQRFPAEYLVETHEVVKNNGIHMDSLTIRGEGRRISPNFYLNHLYEQYQQGTSVSEIAEEIVHLYEHSIQECENLEVDFSYENCEEKIVLRLASGVWNREILELVPHIPFMDMVILFYVVLRVDEEGIGSVRISNQMQEQWKISTKSLFTLALENVRRLFPEKIGSLLKMLKERVSVGERRELLTFLEREYEEVETGGPYVITNSCGINGATVILYPNVLREMGEKFGRDYYLLPSSIHEFLAIPCRPDLSGEDLEMMVKEVNRTCVAREELLSEKVYYYNIQSGKISVWEKTEG